MPNGCEVDSVRLIISPMGSRRAHSIAARLI